MHGGGSVGPTYAALLRTARWVAEEAREAFYRINMFEVALWTPTALAHYDMTYGLRKYNVARDWPESGEWDMYRRLALFDETGDGRPVEINMLRNVVLIINLEIVATVWGVRGFPENMLVALGEAFSRAREVDVVGVHCMQRGNITWNRFLAGLVVQVRGIWPAGRRVKVRWGGIEELSWLMITLLGWQTVVERRDREGVVEILWADGVERISDNEVEGTWDNEVEETLDDEVEGTSDDEVEGTLG
ncbi:hypothetical protein EJ06DRAFT_408247 [Trichodelitschia bisporula]|uniref:Uncharacterized protein n=1 Tax=Trichodelitschia bisporula TaxID=703511 RepID=A0A6G1HY08_9PEZI|nr:hypothetical protein EJ06DRAFT_408247 [Trichodelitschia bisporula]